MQHLLQNIRACQLCEGLPLGPRPILQASSAARVLIAGQAPGRITHAKGRPFDDPSGERLRNWLGVSRDRFYDDEMFAIVPMGFCFPGTGTGGDSPPRPLCAQTWRGKIMSKLESLQLTLVIGQYALAWHFPKNTNSLTQLVRAYMPDSKVIALPHPSPRNGIWLKRNVWFEAEVLPILRRRVAEALA